MSRLMNIAETALDTMKSLTDNKKGPLHVGEIMDCWTYASYLDGVIDQYLIARNTTQDKELLDLFKDAFDITIAHKKELDQFMKEEHIPLTDGYHPKPKSDANAIPNSVRQTDKELINVLQINVVFAVELCARAATRSLRADVGIMFFKFQTDKMMIGLKSKSLAQKKGWLRIPPSCNQTLLN